MYPDLYKTFQKGSLNLKSLLSMVFVSLYQACVILLMTVTLFNEPYMNIVTISFTSLILVEVINVLMETKSIKLVMVFACLTTLVFYIVSIFIFRTMF